MDASRRPWREVFDAIEARRRSLIAEGCAWPAPALLAIQDALITAASAYTARSAPVPMRYECDADWCDEERDEYDAVFGPLAAIIATAADD